MANGSPHYRPGQKELSPNMPTQISRGALAALLVTALAACHTSTLAPASTTADSAAVRADIAVLSSDALEGRATGAPGNDSAAAYLVRRYRSLALHPVLQHFIAHSIADAHAGRNSNLRTQNVFAILSGTDARLRGQYIVIGAHFDHLGRSPDFALDPDAKNAIRPGADDNASGTAAVLELARLFALRPAARPMLFVNFSGEELGDLGSEYFVQHAPVPLDSVDAMLNFDMVGRLKADKLLVYGTATAAELPAIVTAANVEPKFTLTAIGDGFGASDHASFYGKNISVLHFFTDVHEDYHRATDRIEKINAAGEARVIDFAARIARVIADRPGRLTFTRAPEPQRTASSSASSSSTSSTGYGPAYLGTIPEMGATEIRGVRLSGVREGSPADKAGLKSGDVIVELGGTPIGDLYAYTDALRAHKPGDVVAVIILRDGARSTLTVTLGERK
ncbi:MAG: M28 family peptidase [Gemmatimonadota bacterium]|nr:M28 family peptidase [Gemmatimonadota bacterium]